MSSSDHEEVAQVSQSTPPPSASSCNRLGLLRQYAVAFTACLSVMSAGCAYTWVEPLMERLKSGGSEMHLTKEQVSWMTAIIELGPLITPVPVGFLVNWLGRKVTLLLAGPWYIITWVMLLAHLSYPVLIVARFMQGMGIGVIMTTAPLYLGEVASAEVRGAVGTLVQCMWYVGGLFVYVVGPKVSYTTLTWACAAPPLVFVLVFVWCPESPYWFSLKGRAERCERCLQWLRGGQAVGPELAALESSVREEAASGKASWAQLVGSPAGRRALAAVLFTGLATYMSGLRTVQAYAADTFINAAGPTGADDTAVVMGVVTLVATAGSGVLVDRWGRRPVLLVATIGSTVVLLATSLFFRLRTPGLLYTPHVALSLYSVLMSFSSSVGFTLQAELFPTTVRGLASGTTTFCTTIMCFLSLKMYYFLNELQGLDLVYLVFALFAAAGAGLIYKYVPETKGKTFKEIQKMIS